MFRLAGRIDVGSLKWPKLEMSCKFQKREIVATRKRTS